MRWFNSFFYVDRNFYRQNGGGFVFGAGNAGALRQMSDETGGHVFQIDRKMTLQNAFDELNAEMRSQYSIAYTPPIRPRMERSGASKSGLEIRIGKCKPARGYYAIKPES